jgi:hypothetical protein
LKKVTLLLTVGDDDFADALMLSLPECIDCYFLTFDWQTFVIELCSLFSSLCPRPPFVTFELDIAAEIPRHFFSLFFFGISFMLFSPR